MKMFLKILFKKHGLRENKYFEAAVYGLFYCVFSLLLFLLIKLILNRFSNIEILLYSLGIGILMSVIYLVKCEVYSFRRDIKK